MRHVILTCINHLNLRWSCKEIAMTDGKYNGQRSIFYSGAEPLTWFKDMSGVYGDRTIPECSCSSKDLIVASEDSQVKL